MISDSDFKIGGFQFKNNAIECGNHKDYIIIIFRSHEKGVKKVLGEI